MSRTPYELRFEILMLARQHAMEKFHAKYDFMRTQVEKSNLPAPKLKAWIEQNKVPYPELTDILKLADEMKSFVDKG